MEGLEQLLMLLSDTPYSSHSIIELPETYLKIMFGNYSGGVRKWVLRMTS